MIAIIPARGGSKGVPRKNVRLLNGKPLISYTIEAAIGSKYVSKVIVSTDDNEIAEVALSCGAEVPFMRPPELATDTAKAIDTYLYTINRLESIYNEPVENFIVLLPTAPLRTSDDIDKAITIFLSNKAETVISVMEANHPPSWYKQIDANGILKNYFNEVDNSLNRQEAPKSYLPNGAIYIFNYQKLKSTNDYYNNKTFPYVMSINHSIDIDNEVDFLLAEILIQTKENNK